MVRTNNKKDRRLEAPAFSIKGREGEKGGMMKTKFRSPLNFRHSKSNIKLASPGGFEPPSPA